MNTNEVTYPVLDLYCQWLNMWTEAEAVEGFHHRYTRDQFLVHDPDRRLWGTTELRSVIPNVSYHDLYIYQVTDGDEGGPAVLYAWIHAHDGHIVYLAQEFDTMVQMIYSEEDGWLRRP